ncbi:MAG: hypothetical protein SPE63_00150 [Prevotella sp.]|nr:hypothetical protein [Prevotella sp.]
MAWLNAAFAAVGLAIGFFVSFLKDKKKLKTSCGGGKKKTIETIFLMTNYKNGKRVFLLF